MPYSIVCYLLFFTLSIVGCSTVTRPRVNSPIIIEKRVTGGEASLNETVQIEINNKNTSVTELKIVDQRLIIKGSVRRSGISNPSRVKTEFLDKENNLLLKQEASIKFRHARLQRRRPGRFSISVPYDERIKNCKITVN